MRVPTYDGRQVATRPIHQQSVQGRAIPEAFGGGQGMMALAQGMGQLGKALAEVRDLEDMTRAKDAENEFALYMQGAMYGENGYMLSEGRGAFEGRAGFMEAAEKKRREIAGRLKGGAARKFNEASTMRMLDVNGVALRHAGTQQKAWVQESSTARTELFRQDAWNAIGDEEAVNKSIAAGLLEIQGQAQLDGISGEALRLKEMAYISSTRAGIVAQLAQADPIAADEYLKKHADQIDAATRLDLEQKLEEPVLWARAGRELQMGQMKRVGDFKFSPQVTDAITKAAGKHGVPAEALAVIAMLESRGNPNAKNKGDPKRGIKPSSAGGLFQQVDGNAAQYGVKNRFDPYQSADGAARFLRDNQLYLRKRLGREPTIGELYLAHQQGAGGAMKLLANPNARAIDVVGYSEVKSNVPKPKEMSAAEFNAKITNMTAGEFANLWIRKAERVAGSGGVGGGVSMEEHIAKIEDPKLRAATEQLWEKQIAANKAAEKQEQDNLVDYIDKQLIGYPQMDLNSLPLEVQQKLGASKMQTLRNWQKGMLEPGGVKTDDTVYVELSGLYATDKVGFAEIDPLDYRDKLSDSDWKQFMGWWREVREDMADGGDGGKGDKVGLGSAMKQADLALEVVGLTTVGKNSEERKEIVKKQAAFRRALANELSAFAKANKRKANELEVEEIINKLTLPMIKVTPGWLFGTNDKEGHYLYEGYEGDDDGEFKPAIDYNRIPIDERETIKIILEAELGRRPSKEEVYLRWFEMNTGLKRVEEKEEGGGAGD